MDPANEEAAKLESLQEENLRLRAQVERLEALATTDPLTGLANRRSADERLGELFAASNRYTCDLSCLMIDLDGLKRVNDALGHAEGDQLIRAAAEVLRTTIRRSDFAARVGGDEFMVLLPRTPASTAAILAGRLAARFDSHCEGLINRLGGETPIAGPSRLRVHVTRSGMARNPDRVARPGMSIGIASRISSGATTPVALTDAADRALYNVKAAKHAGVPCAGVRVYVPTQANALAA